jgi:hypothetical protein
MTLLTIKMKYPFRLEGFCAQSWNLILTVIRVGIHLHEMSVRRSYRQREMSPASGFARNPGWRFCFGFCFWRSFHHDLTNKEVCSGLKYVMPESDK